MTNLEKAREYSEIQIADTITERRIKEAYLNACEWKDEQYSQDEAYNRGIHDACQQFKEYLEKKRDGYISQRDNADMWSEQWAVFHALACTMHRIINELFPATEQNKED